MPLEKEKLRSDKKRYERISSLMFLVVLAMIAGLAYISYDNIRKKWDLEENKRQLNETNERLNDSTQLLSDMRLRHEADLVLKDELIKELEEIIQKDGKRAAQKEATMAKAKTEKISENIYNDKQTAEDLRKVERLGDALDGRSGEWTDEQLKEKEMEYEQIQKRNPNVDAVIQASSKLQERDTGRRPDRIRTPAGNDNFTSSNSGNGANAYVVLDRNKGLWLKEGLTKSWPKADNLKLSVLKLNNKQALLRCSFATNSSFRPWTFEIGERETKTFVKGDYKIVITFLKTGTAGRNPLNKAMYYTCTILKKA